MTPTGASKRGRPLAFLVGVGLAWVGLRSAILLIWPEPEAIVVSDRLASGGGEPVELAVPGGTETQGGAPTDAITVDSLESPPPPHLATGQESLPSAAAHNAMWMAASRESMPAEPVSMEVAPSPAPEENF